MDKFVKSNFKRGVVHGLSPNAKKDFTNIRCDRIKNPSEKILFDLKSAIKLISDEEENETEILKDEPISNNLLNDSFNYSEFDILENILSTSDDDDESKNFLYNLKSLDLIVTKIFKRCFKSAQRLPKFYLHWSIFLNLL